MKIIRVLTFVIGTCFFVNTAFAQENAAEDANQEPVFNIVETMPQFPGGRDSLVSFLIKNLTYPEADRAAGKEGKVYLSFIVEKDGSVTEVTPVGKVTEMATPSMVDEAMRIVNLLPPFEPGTQRGKTVRCRYVLPLVFKLQ